MSRAAPFAPLLAGGDGLDLWPAPPEALRARMGAYYGAPPEAVLPVRGATHGLDLAMRLAAHEGYASIAAPAREPFAQLARLNRLALVAAPRADTGLVVGEAAAEGYAIADESLIEFTAQTSRTGEAARGARLIVLRSLSYAFGLAGARVGAVIANPALIARLADLMEPYALPTPSVRLAEQALAPARLPLALARIEEVKAERARVRAALTRAGLDASEGEGPFVLVRTEADPSAAFARFGARGALAAPGLWRIDIAVSALNDAALAAFGVAADVPRRQGEAVRDTRETRIAARVDLDAPPGANIATGVGFFDHMLEQVALHGGFHIALSCEGDLEVDAHHTIEDCALALGQALKAALGARAGIARYGFVLPMDEAEAKVSLDLGGRAYWVFEGAFKAASIGAYPTEMTAHVFRSLAQSMGAAIHVAVTGENDHHKTEACFKAFGRALRQAVRREGEAIPSTKGVIA